MNAKTREIHLKWIHTSDVHGSLFSYDYLRKKEVSGGLSVIYDYTLELRRQYGDRLILTDGGDRSAADTAMPTSTVPACRMTHSIRGMK